MSTSRNERLKQMHERRLLWKPIPRCAECGRTLTAMVIGSAPCERCLTVAGDVVADTTASVAAAFAAAVSDPQQLVERTRAIPSIWDARLRPGGVTARIASGSVRGQQRGWSVLRLAPAFGADTERFALAESAVGEGVRVVLAAVAPSARVVDLRNGRTLVLTAA
jgi:hypothetical protein